MAAFHCAGCGESARGEFYPHSKYRCRTCTAARARHRYHSNIEVERTRSREYNRRDDVKSHKKRRRDSRADHFRDLDRRRKFGIGSEDIARILKHQGGCGVCLRQSSPREWHVDHCHKTGYVRGILCGGCNTMLGRLGDSYSSVVEWADRMLTYLYGARRPEMPDGASCLAAGGRRGGGRRRVSHPHPPWPDLPPRWPVFTDADVADMVRRYNHGERHADIAKSYGVSHTTIGTLIRTRAVGVSLEGRAARRMRATLAATLSGSDC